MMEVTTQKYDYNIFYISTFYNMPPQVEGGGSTWKLKWKAVNEAVGSGLVKTLLLLNFGPHVLETVYTFFEQSVGV
jgi:diketogulonate reductase-like aldo/keto reductase